MNGYMIVKEHPTHCAKQETGNTYPHFCVTLCKQLLLLISSVVVVLDQHIKIPPNSKRVQRGVHLGKLGLSRFRIVTFSNINVSNSAYKQSKLYAEKRNYVQMWSTAQIALRRVRSSSHGKLPCFNIHTDIIHDILPAGGVQCFIIIADIVNHTIAVEKIDHAFSTLSISFSILLIFKPYKTLKKEYPFSDIP